MGNTDIIVYIPDEAVYGRVISYGTYHSIVKYAVGGIDYEVIMLNDDLDFLEEIETEEEE